MAMLAPVSIPTWSSCFSAASRDLKANLPCTEATEAAFTRAVISKLDKNGKVKVYPGTDQATGKKIQLKDFVSILDRTTGDLYLNERPNLVRMKCMGIMLGMPLYTLATIGWHLTKIPVVITVIALDILKTIPSSCRKNESEKAWIHFKQRVSDMVSVTCTGLFEALKAPFYLIAAEGAAFVGVFNPYLGRKWVGKVEHSWQNYRSYKEDFRKIPERPNETCWESFVKDVIQARAFYLAYCFQVRGNITDKNIRLIKEYHL